MVLLDNEEIYVMIGSRQETIATNDLDRHMKAAMAKKMRVTQRARRMAETVNRGRQVSGDFELLEDDWQRDRLAGLTATDVEVTDDNSEQPYRMVVQ